MCGANITRAGNGGTHTGQHRAYTLKNGFATAKHDREFAGLGAWHAARNRRVNHVRANRGDLFGQAACDGGHARTHFDHDSVFAQSGEHAIRAFKDRLNDRTGRQNRDDDVRCCRERAVGCCDRTAEFFGEGLRAFRRRIDDLQRIASFVQKGSHGPAHAAYAYKTYGGFGAHFLTAFLVVGFLATAFLAVAFFAVVFLAADFLAADFFTALAAALV